MRISVSLVAIPFQCFADSQAKVRAQFKDPRLRANVHWKDVNGTRDMEAGFVVSIVMKSPSYTILRPYFYPMHSYPLRSPQNPVSSLAIACCHLATCHLLATRPCESHQVIHAEIRSAVEVIRQEDQDWLVSGWVPTGHYWTFAKREKIAYSNGLISVISCLKIA